MKYYFKSHGPCVSSPWPIWYLMHLPHSSTPTPSGIRDQLAAKGGVTYGISPLLAIAYANRGGLPPNRAHTALPLWPDILTISRGNPDAKKNDILLNLGLRMGQNRSKSALQLPVLDEHPKRNYGIQRKNFHGFTSRPYRVYQIRLICALDDK